MSGDYYDFISLGEERVGIAVGDISGSSRVDLVTLDASGAVKRNVVPSNKRARRGSRPWSQVPQTLCRFPPSWIESPPEI